MREITRVLIVEDDFRIAAISQAFVEQVPDFQVVGLARSGADALTWLADNGGAVDLIILDVYLPDAEGLSLLWEIRRLYRDLNIVMMTAAKEVEVVEEALRAGVFDFLIKPVTVQRLHKMLDKFRSRRRLMQARSEFNQADLDATLSSLAERDLEPARRSLPKGVDPLTLAATLDALREKKEALTAAEVGLTMGCSRSTARRYLEYLAGQGQVQVEQSYGDIGRPQRQYRWQN
ncbi:MAG: response regulator [Polaromonas sp.]|nr:response regulator [Polaromonas sp.]